MAPRQRVGGIYAKPIMGEDLRTDPAKVLRKLKAELNRRLKQKLQITAFSDAAKKRIAKSLQIRIKKSSLTITTNFAGFFPLMNGQKRSQMTWLTKARAPIPIVLDTGELIFRNATPQSMTNGSWWHPGRSPSNFVDKAKKEAREFVKEHMHDALMKQLKSALSGK